MKKQKKRRRRSRLPLFLLLLVLVLAGALYRGNTAIQVTEFDPVFADLPAGFDGCRLLVLSDLQALEFGKGNRHVLETAEEVQPEYILLVGDLADRYRDLPDGYMTALAEGLTSVAPTCYVTGNHDWDAKAGAKAIKAELSAGGVTVLSNQYVPLERNGDTVFLAGVDDPNGYADQKTPEELAAELYAAEGDPFWMLMAHRNDLFEEQYSRLGADLVFSGHAHGGIIRFPCMREGLLGHGTTVHLPFTHHGTLRLPRLFAPYSTGLYEVNGSALFVTRGLGRSGWLLRVFNRPEAAVVTLHRG